MKVLDKRFWLLMGAPLIVFTAAAFAAEQEQTVETERVLKGEQYAGRGDWHSAAQQFFDAISEDPNNSVALYDLGVAYLHLGDLGKARLAEEQAIIVKPNFVNARIQLATILCKLGDATLAEAVLRKALEFEPSNQTAQRNLNVLLDGKQRNDERAPTVPANQGRPAIGVTAKELDTEGGSKLVLPSNSEGEGPSCRFEEAQIRIGKNEKSLKPEVAARVDEALAACRQGRLAAAKKLLTEVIAADPAVSCAYASLGAIAGLEGNYDAEIAKEKIAIELDEQNATAHYNLGWALARAGRLKESLHENERALELDPNFLEAAVGKAIAVSEMGSIGVAKELLQESIQKFPSEILPHLALSTLLEREGSLDASQAQVEAAMRLKPDSQLVKQRLAFVALRKEDWAHAGDLFSQIVKANGQNAQAWLGLGLALEKSGERAASLEAFQNAVNMSPSSAAAHMAYGLALEKSGDAGAAAKHFEEADRLNLACRVAGADDKKSTGPAE